MPPLEGTPDLEPTRESLNLYSRVDGMNGPWFVLQVGPTYRPSRRLSSDRQIERFLTDRIDRSVNFDPLGDAAYLGGGPLQTMYGSPGYGTVHVINSFGGGSAGSIRTRAVLAGERVFVLQVRVHNNTEASDEIEDAFFDSLQITAPVVPEEEVSP